jgi:hypothetical protein
MKQAGQTRVIKVLREKHPKIKGTGFCLRQNRKSGLTDYGH